MGRKALDLTNLKFGLLTVLERVYKKEDTKNSYWLCECDCGSKPIIVAGCHLKSGATVSCGCFNNIQRKAKYKNIINKRFGKLTVIAKTDKKAHNRILWLCKCDCGNICEVTIDNLERDTNSCGCIKTELLLEDCVENTRLRNLTSKKRERGNNKDSGVKGVVWDNSRNKWKAQIKLQNKNIYLGRYNNLEDAIKVRQEAEEKYFKPILEKYKKSE